MPTKIIGCIHLLPLPGSPGYNFDKKTILDRALEDLEIYNSSNIEGIIIENTFDIPYLKGYVYPETISTLSIICNELRKRYKGYLGLQVLAAANLEALSIAYAADLDFIRVEGFAFAHVADEGIIESSAAELMRKRANLRASNIRVIADIKKKHSSHAITSDISIAEMARLTEYLEPDGIVLTGLNTGTAPCEAEVKAVKDAISIPLYIGSGVDEINICTFKNLADYVIVGTYFKKDNALRDRIDSSKILRLMELNNKDD